MFKRKKKKVVKAKKNKKPNKKVKASKKKMNKKTVKGKKPAKRIIRKDCTVKTLREKYGLDLRDSKGRRIRGDKKVGTIRKGK